MSHPVLKHTLICAALLLGSGLALSAQAKPEIKGHKAAMAAPKAKTKAPAKGKLVDINSASKDELKQLPGITDAYADQIIAGRPYRTKAHLLTHKILPQPVYAGVKANVIAKQTGLPIR